MKRPVLISAFIIAVMCFVPAILLAEPQDKMPSIKKTKQFCESDIMRCLPPPKKYKNPDEAILKGLNELCLEHMAGHWNDKKLECERGGRIRN